MFRYLPAETQIRAEVGTPLVEIVRVAAAAARAGGSVRLSVAEALPTEVASAIRRSGIPIAQEDAAAAHARLAALPRPRVRLLGAAAAVLDAAAQGRPDIAVFDGPATRAGRIELLPFLHEQAVSITAHRFGNPDGVRRRGALTCARRRGAPVDRALCRRARTLSTRIGHSPGERAHC